MFEGKNDQSVVAERWRPLVSIDKKCFGCGTENPHGLQMQFESDGNRLRSTLVMDGRFRGWSNLIHGGVLSTILDETMGWSVLVLTRQFMLTKGMQVSFKKPVRIGMQLTATGYIKEWLSERKIVVVAEIRDETGALCTSSQGEFVLFDRDTFLKMGIMEPEEMDAMLAAIP